MRESETSHIIHTKPQGIEFQGEPRIVRRADIEIANIALRTTVRTRPEAILDDREAILDSRPETD